MVPVSARLVVTVTAVGAVAALVAAAMSSVRYGFSLPMGRL